jgi:hypothetical protein
MSETSIVSIIICILSSITAIGIAVYNKSDRKRKKLIVDNKTMKRSPLFTFTIRVTFGSTFATSVISGAFFGHSLILKVPLIEKFSIIPDQIYSGNSVRVEWNTKNCDSIILEYFDTKKTLNDNGTKFIKMDNLPLKFDTIIKFRLTGYYGSKKVISANEVMVYDTTSKVTKKPQNRPVSIKKQMVTSLQNVNTVKYNLKGQVIDNTGKGIDSVMVLVEDYFISTFTNKDGCFSLIMEKEKDEPWLRLQLFPSGNYENYSALVDTSMDIKRLTLKSKKK